MIDYDARTVTQIGLLEEGQLNSLNAFVAAAGVSRFRSGYRCVG